VPSSLTPIGGSPPAVQRVRLCYRKIGPARFIGTRELTTVFFRAARRAGLPLAFSNGHHPLPRLSFGPGLPVGFASEEEFVDLELIEHIPADEVAARLGRELPEGLEPRQAMEVAQAAPSIEAEIAGLVYEVDLASLETPPASAAVAGALARFASAETFPVNKRGKRGDRIVDARRAVRSLDMTGPLRLRLEVAVESEGTLRPGALLAPLLGLDTNAAAALSVRKLHTVFQRDRPTVDAALP
jgi:radical SAM-linked protein